jgi:hypothetical protein
MSVISYLRGPLGTAEELGPVLTEGLGAHVFSRRDDVKDEQGLVGDIGFHDRIETPCLSGST